MNNVLIPLLLGMICGAIGLCGTIARAPYTWSTAKTFIVGLIAGQVLILFVMLPLIYLGVF